MDDYIYFFNLHIALFSKRLDESALGKSIKDNIVDFFLQNKVKTYKVTRWVDNS